jgi:hypothetical protein
VQFRELPSKNVFACQSGGGRDFSEIGDQTKKDSRNFRCFPYNEPEFSVCKLLKTSGIDQSPRRGTICTEQIHGRDFDFIDKCNSLVVVEGCVSGLIGYAVGSTCAG